MNETAINYLELSSELQKRAMESVLEAMKNGRLKFTTLGVLILPNVESAHPGQPSESKISTKQLKESDKSEQSYENKNLVWSLSRNTDVHLDLKSSHEDLESDINKSGYTDNSFILLLTVYRLVQELDKPRMLKHLEVLLERKISGEEVDLDVLASLLNKIADQTRLIFKS